MNAAKEALRRLRSNAFKTVRFGGMYVTRMVTRNTSSSAQRTPIVFKPPIRRTHTDIAGSLGIFGAGFVTVAFAEKEYKKKPIGLYPVTSATTRLQSDVCHLAPGISEVLLRILELLEETCDKYVRSMNKRVNELDGNLQKYGSTLSLNLAGSEAEDYALSDPGSEEIQQFRKNYRAAYKTCSEMVSGLEKFLTSAQQLGGRTCVEDCQRKLDEILYLLDDMERRVHVYETKLTMAEKHFHGKRRRVGHGKMLS